MATKKKALNARNLESLGAPRLAELLIEITAGDAAAKRHLRLELAGADSAAAAGAEIRKRLAAIGRARSFVDRRAARALAHDLDMQREAIAKHVAERDPALGLELTWRFLGLADSVFHRCDDSGGVVGDVFYLARSDLGKAAAAAQPDPVTLADQTFRALTRNDNGQYDGLIGELAAALGDSGIDHLKRRMLDLSKTPVPRPPDREREAVAWGPRGTIYADEMAERQRKSTVRQTLMDIADAQSDVDAYIDQYDEETRRLPHIAADLARRLLAAKRAKDALKFLDAADDDGARAWLTSEWEDARIEALQALGRGDEAQELRWQCFHASLSEEHLRAYLKRLPDFDDVEAEERALDHALAFPHAAVGLSFLISWPELHRAATLVLRRADELSGDHYPLLSRAADSLVGTDPLAATLALRRMIGFTLTEARSTRYKYAARDLAECGRLASGIEDFGDFETHDAYVARLREEHGRKRAFWSRFE